MNDSDGIPIVALGEGHLVEGFVLGGAHAIAAESPEEVLREWEALPHEAVVILTGNAAAAVAEHEGGTQPSRKMTVVMPQ
jgi:vacuolar-type H+-ATPase subunit F/Vma7